MEREQNEKLVEKWTTEETDVIVCDAEYDPRLVEFTKLLLTVDEQETEDDVETVLNTIFENEILKVKHGDSKRVNKCRMNNRRNERAAKIYGQSAWARNNDERRN
jgi:hypothetical protein